ncbi:MAG: hypothetical protein LBN95_13345 [Prevotellaceae bacterium]|jgi:hypothetical protein|nr:hypothetical protein [Prevotellaceae bacterium]
MKRIFFTAIFIAAALVAFAQIEQPKPKPAQPSTTKPVQSTQNQQKSQKQIQCEQRWKDGKEAYDNGDYSTALFFFNKAVADGCTNMPYADYIELCNMKMSANATLTVSPTEVEFDAAGGSKTISISTSMSWSTPVNTASWVTMTKYSNSISLTCAANTATSERTDYFKIKAGDKEVRVNIKQKGATQANSVSSYLKAVNQLITMNMNSSPTQNLDNGNYKGQRNSDNQRSGLGAYYWSSGEFYFGEWSKGSRNGNSLDISLNGNSFDNCSNCIYFVGDWLNGEKSGTGTCYDKNGNWLYYGNFANDKPTGNYTGTATVTDWKFKVIEYSNGDIYIGETYEGNRHGYGVFLWKAGGMWYGYWKDGIRAGTGIHIYMDGRVSTGTWNGDTKTN